MNKTERKLYYLAKEHEFIEYEHPRDTNGEFKEKDQLNTRKNDISKFVGTRREGRELKQEDGAEIPEHIKNLKLPPGWLDVKYNIDPNAALLAVAKDSKGRPQYVYSQEFADSQAEAKFARVAELQAKFPEIDKQNQRLQKSTKPAIKDAADCLNLIMKMGVRPGSEENTGAKVKAYGATNLLGQHVVKQKDGVYLIFTGKKGVALNLKVPDKDLAKNLLERKANAGNDGQIFPNLNEKILLNHVHSLDGGGFKTKDFRTHRAAMEAIKLMKDKPDPTNEKEYKKAVMDIAKEVSKVLGNTPIICLQSYIPPYLFGNWRMSSGV